MAATLLGSQAFAADPAERIVKTLRAANPDVAWPSAASLRLACGDDRRCYVERIASVRPEIVRLVAVNHPDSDSIRWVRTVRSVKLDVGETGADLRITRFGRKAVMEVREALSEIAAHWPRATITIDLIDNAGGDFERMLEVAGLLVGPHRDAVRIDGADSTRWRDVPGRADTWRPRIDRVRVGSTTASSAEVLAALLRRYGGADLCGAATADRATQKRLVTVDHDVRLVVQSARMAVPPLELRGGLVPVQPCR